MISSDIAYVKSFEGEIWEKRWHNRTFINRKYFNSTVNKSDIMILISDTKLLLTAGLVDTENTNSYPFDSYIKIEIYNGI